MIDATMAPAIHLSREFWLLCVHPAFQLQVIVVPSSSVVPILMLVTVSPLLLFVELRSASETIKSTLAGVTAQSLVGTLVEG